MTVPRTAGDSDGNHRGGPRCKSRPRPGGRDRYGRSGPLGARPLPQYGARVGESGRGVDDLDPGGPDGRAPRVGSHGRLRLASGPVPEPGDRPDPLRGDGLPAPAPRRPSPPRGLCQPPPDGPRRRVAHRRRAGPARLAAPPVPDHGADDGPAAADPASAPLGPDPGAPENLRGELPVLASQRPGHGATLE